MFEGIKGKRVLITGASGGMGTAMAELFADYGARLGLHYSKNESSASQLLVSVRKKEAEAEVFKANLLHSEEITKLADSFIKQFGGVDVLINNAGAVFDQVNFTELEEKSWQDTFDLNAKAPFILSRRVFDTMKKQGGGKIINLSSVNVKYAGSGRSMHYVASKAALESITRTFAKEGAEHKILVNAIRPGVINTPMHTRIKGYNEKDFQKRIDLIPLKRAGEPDDIAKMALFLAAETGDFITGEIFTVAGGD